MSNNQKATIDSVRAALSAARMATYEAAAGVQQADDPSALLLYAWNAEVSGALLSPLHICEVLIRNAVADALEALYGPQWPWSATFEHSLPNPSKGFSPKSDLQKGRHKAATTGKVIPELKFVFWQSMFTGRHDGRIWNPQLRRVMPGLSSALSIPDLRKAIYSDLDQLRSLRNRIAHHEPIFTRNLADDYAKILELVTYRCAVTAAWLNANQRATAVIAAKP